MFLQAGSDQMFSKEVIFGQDSKFDVLETFLTCAKKEEENSTTKTIKI
jgi:hypothetical protein